MRYGHFDDERREYVVTRPDTPLPWINYLGGGGFTSIVSNTAAGYAFQRDARLRRLTRFRYNAAPLNQGGRFIYLRDDESGEYWSPTWQPVQRDLEEYVCRHGLGYTVIGSRFDGIRAETTFVVPLADDVEVWRVRVTNERDVAARLSLFAAVEFALWDAQDDATNFQRNYSIGEVEVDPGVIYHRSEYRERRNHFAFFAASTLDGGWDTQRDAFLGPHGGWERPLAVERGMLSGSLAHGWQPIGAHHAALALAPAESREIVLLLGYAENPADAKFDPPGTGRLARDAARRTIARYLEPGAVEEALARLGESWCGTLAGLQVESGNEHLDRMINTWTPYQCMVAFNVARSASMFESGIGRGIGFRDANQDLLGVVHMAPQQARQRLLDLAGTQLETGGAYHQYQPLTGRGNDDIGSGFSDDPLWLVLATAAYLRETGDLPILDEPVAYDNGRGPVTPLYEHLERALSHTDARLGPHGLPLIGRADWNDCLNLNAFSLEAGEPFQTVANRDGGTAESTVVAALYVLASREMAHIARLCHGEAAAARLLQAAQRMAEAIGRHAWDGDWFLRAFDAAGQLVGSAANEEGQIFVEPQGLCVMAGVGLDDGRAARALGSVRERLLSPHGVMLLRPPYSRYRVELGEISSYPPGYKENGAVFCHTNPWLVIAEAMVGNAGEAMDHYLRINPSAREELSEVHRCEPYVYAQMIAGVDAATPGEAKNSWLTGTASWNYVAATQWILGIRPEHDGLRIDPCLPDDWGDVRVTRRFRGSLYRITILKPPGAGGRVSRLVVDGVPVEGNLAPLPADPEAEIIVEAHVG